MNSSNLVTVILSILGIGFFLWMFPEIIGPLVTVGGLFLVKFILFDSTLCVRGNHHGPEEALYGSLWHASEKR